MQWGFPRLPSRSFAQFLDNHPHFSSPAISASNGSGRPPGTYGVIALGLLGLFSLDAYETRLASQTLSMQESKPLKKRAGAYCPFHADSEKPPVPWLFRHN